MTSRYTEEDYAGAGQAISPTGPVWSFLLDGPQRAMMLALAKSLARLDADAMQLLGESLPGNTQMMLPEWEAAMGLPDPCAGPNPTVQQRQSQVVARFAGIGGQNRQFFIDFAKDLGFEVEVHSHAPFRVGHSRMGDPLGGPEWFFAWTLTVLSAAASLDRTLFRMGQGKMGDPLAGPSFLDVLECEVGRLAAAETQPLFDTSKQITLVNRTPQTMQISDGRTIAKIAGNDGAAAWGDASVISAEGYVGDVHLSWQAVTTSKWLMVGLNTDPTTDDGYTGIDYAFHQDGGGNLYVFESGVNQGQWTYAAGDRMMIVRTGTTLNYLKRSATTGTLSLLRSITVSATTQLFMDSSFSNIGGSVTDLRLAA